MSAKLTAELVFSERTGKAIADLLPTASDGKTAANVLANLVLGGRTRMRVTVDEVTPVAATGTITCVVASMTAGDTILIDDVILTCVAGAASASGGTYSKDTSNTACGISLAAAINGYAPLKGLVTATESSGTVTVTARRAGSIGNDIKLRKKVTTGAAHVLSGSTLSGGKSESNRVTSVLTCSQANVDADDTIRIGKTTFTAKVAASAEGEFTIGASDTAMGDNLLAKIIAHTDLAGIVTGVNVAGAITLTWHCDPRLAVHVGYMVSSDADGLVVTTQPTASSVTYASSLATRSYNLGAP